MRILFVSNYFPPEVNAPATRTYEHAKQWVQDGHEVEVLTSVPNFPEGRVYEGYENRLVHETIDGIDVTRVPMYVTSNEGIVKRSLSYLSFMCSAWWHGRGVQRPDVVVATSPQFFAGVGGYLLHRHLEVPFVLEVRDLWPESIVAVGAMRRNSVVIQVLERLERFLYEQSDHIVVVTDAFKRFITAKGIREDKVTVLKNGVDLDVWNAPLDEVKVAALREKHDLEGKFVASYIGTIGMAHRVDVLFEAARRCTDSDVVFMVVGTGAEREELARRQAALQLPNFRLVDKVPKEEVPYLLELTDVSIVHLRKSPLFETVIPSKIFETMATKTPIVLGVEGETKEIIEAAGAGIPIEPENVDELVDAVLLLKRDPELGCSMAESGYEHVHAEYDRRNLARRYVTLLEQVACGMLPVELEEAQRVAA